ncbi:hypothetical protein SAMN03159343_2072 [Klenkia marina]|uniref:Uncharacterized protein n=1 Tax=Klenkia marina TaxID=1960309 RepID=A0A1G4Y6A0_9ACTN|nr:hypothetical protein [Klenkia marina]SCX48945.1 hypothetical protein SAMN03159343_2072 [Klenkia marina]
MADHEDDAAEPTEAAAILRRVLDAVDRGEITSTQTERDRLEGAAVALEGLAGNT